MLDFRLSKKRATGGREKQDPTAIFPRCLFYSPACSTGLDSKPNGQLFQLACSDDVAYTNLAFEPWIKMFVRVLGISKSIR